MHARPRETRKDRCRAWLPWLCAACGLAIDLFAWWPGYMSFDPAYTWWQARGNPTTDLGPLVSVHLWRLTGYVIEGPAGPFVLHLVLFWSGLAALAGALRLGAIAMLGAMLVVAFTPLPWLMRAHAWTDVGLYCALVFATGFLARADRERRPRLLLLVLPALAYAGMVRHNALPAILPFACWVAWLVARDAKPAWASARATVGLVAAGQLVLIIATAAWLNAQADRRVPLWPILAQYDLAAMSIATDRMLLPRFMLTQDLDVATLAGVFRIWSTNAMLVGGGLRDPVASSYTVGELATLRHRWLDAIRESPAIWIAHRWRFTRALFGGREPGWPTGLVFVDAEIQYRDNPPVQGNTGRVNRVLIGLAKHPAGTRAFAAWPYLAAGLIAFPLAWRRRRGISTRLAACLLASAWAYALPHVVLASSAEVRYLAWPCVASVLALAVLVATRRDAVKAARAAPAGQR